MVICNEQHRFIVAEQLRQLNKLTENIILEPAGRNTAPAIALAALAAKRHSPESDPLMLVLAADHVIADEDAFRAAVRNAMPYAEAGKLVTFGIVRNLPEPVMAIFVAVKCLRVSRIWWPLKWRSLSKNRIWKPLRPMWQAANITGTAACSCSALPSTLKNWPCMPRHPCGVQAAWEGHHADHDFIRPDAGAFLSSPADSIDYAVMEKDGAGPPWFP